MMNHASFVAVLALLCNSVTASEMINIARDAEIKSSATCGQFGAEQFCYLSDHVAIVDSNSPGAHCKWCYDSTTYGIRNAIDESAEEWLSPTLAKGTRYQSVMITVDLKQVYQITSIIIKFGMAPRPLQWVLEKSVDNIKFYPIMNFGRSCQQSFKLPTKSVSDTIGDDEVICTSDFSSMEPITDGEIALSLINNRQSLVNWMYNSTTIASGFVPTQKMLNFTLARYIRLRFQRMNILQSESSQLKQSSVAQRYFYAIRNIFVGGLCMCNGYSETCPYDEARRAPSCSCTGNTCGSNCEVCCPMYNQARWRPGVLGDSAIECEQCNCNNHASSCYYNETVEANALSVNMAGQRRGGGVCRDCRDNTEGINCERCKRGYYRPSGVAPDDSSPCTRCTCRANARMTGECVRDDDQAAELNQPDETLAYEPGDCICKPGFAGKQCNRCAAGFFGYPNCQPCPCNINGTANLDSCESGCECKSNVDTANGRCDTCRERTFNLDGKNAEGCSPCFCFGLEVPCSSLNQRLYKLWNTQDWSVSPRYSRSQLNQRTFWANEMRLQFTSDARRAPFFRQESIREIQSKMMENYEFSEPDFVAARNFYLSAPPQYLGNRVASYGTKIVYRVRVESSSDAMVYGDDVCDLIIQSRTLTLCYRLANQDMTPDSPREVEVPLLIDEGWAAGGNAGTWTLLENLDQQGNELSLASASKIDLMSALVSVERLLVRATYYEDQTALYLESFYMLIASEQPIAGAEYVGKASHAEMCSCPSGFAGTSCESCAFGYRRVDNVLYGGSCQKCDCNDNAATCDPFTGQCLGYCLNNTEGEYCDECSFNHYIWKQPAKCKACGCPRNEPSNFFAARCSASDDGNGWTCEECETGYVGDRCERCADGYYGEPTVLNSTCRQCDCNGNVNQDEPEWCDSRTGQCKSCLHNTAGSRCERCADGFFGDALNRDCAECRCDPIGSVNGSCDSAGQCFCKPNYAGEKCDRCDSGRGDFRNGCPLCACNSVGSVDQECSLEDGSCNCYENYDGRRCDQCAANSYRANGECVACNCDTRGSRNESCSQGNCYCKDGVRGTKCDTCARNYFWSNDNSGCSPCKCNPIGSVNQECDMNTGECNCKQNVDSATSCAKCLPGYYDLTRDGCKQCAPCDSEWHICNDRTGVCQCPPFTTGDQCEQCETNSWGFTRERGCTPCECSRVGSVSAECDSVTGTCECREGYGGAKCDRCADDAYGPNCAKCDCDERGSLNRSCDATGSCYCKPNTAGKKCDKCARDSFLTPNGCTKCFCFGRATACNATAKRVTKRTIEGLSAENAEDGFALQKLAGIRNAYAIPAAESVLLSAPRSGIYWNLSSFVRGDLISSYSMRVRLWLRSAKADASRAVNAPLARMFAQSARLPTTLEYNQNVEIADFEDTQVDIILSESYWKPSFSRDRFLLLLQQVDGFYVRAGDSDALLSAAVVSGELRHTAYDFESYEAVPDDSTAFIERCQCRPGYAGMSCQKVADGYRLLVNETGTFDTRSNSTDSNLIGAVVGNAAACFCNDHTGRCDRITGECLNCQHNTAGRYCDVCAYGYFGPANSTSPNACQPCECPLATNNFAQSCRRVGGGGRFSCDCEPGYTSANCGECAPGFYELGGGPKVERGTCMPCDCSEGGTINGSQLCDRKTGQCLCKAGIDGRRCDKCSHMSALINGRCESCNTGCEGRLMEALSAVNSSLAGYRDKVRLNITFPTAYLESLRRRADAVQSCNNAHKTAQTTIRADLQNLQDRNRTAASNIVDLIQQTSALQNNTQHQRQAILSLQVNITNLNQRVDSFDQLLRTQLRQENDTSRVDTTRILEEARRTLQALKELQKNVTAASGKTQGMLNTTDNLLLQFNRLVERHQTLLGDLKFVSGRFDEVSWKFNRVKNSVPNTEYNVQQVRETMRELEILYNELQVKIEAANNSVLTLSRSRSAVLSAIATNYSKMARNWELIEQFAVYDGIIQRRLKSMNVTVQLRLGEIKQLLQVDELKAYVNRLNSTLSEVTVMFDLKGANASAAALSVREFARQLQDFETMRNNFTADKTAFETEYSNLLQQLDQVEKLYRNQSSRVQYGFDRNASLAEEVRVATAKVGGAVQRAQLPVMRQEVDRLRSSLNLNTAEYEQIRRLATQYNASCSPKQDIAALQGQIGSLLWQAKFLDNFINEDEQYSRVVNDLMTNIDNASQRFDALVRASNDEVTDARRQAVLINDRLERIRQKLSSVRVDVTRFQEDKAKAVRSMFRSNLPNRQSAQKSRSFSLESRVEPSAFLRIEMAFSADAQSVADRGQLLGQLIFNDKSGETIDQYVLSVGLKNRKVIALCKSGASEIREASEAEVSPQTWYSLVVEKYPAGNLIVRLNNVTTPSDTSRVLASVAVGDGYRRSEPVRFSLGGASIETNEFPNTYQGCVGNVYVNGEQVNLFTFESGSRTCTHCVRSLAEALWAPKFSLYSPTQSTDDVSYLPGTGLSGNLFIPLGGVRRLQVTMSLNTWWHNSVILVAGTRSVYSVLYSSDGEVSVYSSQLRQTRRIGRPLVRGGWSSLNFTVLSSHLYVTYPSISASQTDYDVSSTTNVFDFVSIGGFPENFTVPDLPPTGATWLPLSGMVKNIVVFDGSRRIKVDPFEYTTSLVVKDPSHVTATETRAFASSCLLGFYGKLSIAEYRFTTTPQSISFTFRTNTTTSDLLRIASASGSSYFVTLSDGRLLVSSAGTYTLDEFLADSQPHTVSLQFDNDVTKLYVDGRRIDARLPIGQFGATGPVTLTFSAYELIGCVTNLYYNQRRVDASELTRSDNVDVHRCVFLEQQRRAEREKRLVTPYNISIDFAVAQSRPAVTAGGILPFPTIAQSTRRPSRPAKSTTTNVATTSATYQDDACSQRLSSLNSLEDSSDFGFDGVNSGLTIVAKRVSQSDIFSLQFSFRTTRSRTTIVRFADCYLAVSGTMVALACDDYYNIDENNLSIDKDVSDGRWHDVEIDLELLPNQVGRSTVTVKVDESSRTKSWSYTEIFTADEPMNDAEGNYVPSTFNIEFGGSAKIGFVGCISNVMLQSKTLQQHLRNQDYVDRVQFNSLYRCVQQRSKVAFWSNEVMKLWPTPIRMDSMSVNVTIKLMRGQATIFTYYNETDSHGLKVIVNQSRIELLTYNYSSVAKRHSFPKYVVCSESGRYVNVIIRIYTRRMQLGVSDPDGNTQSSFERMDIPKNIVAIPYLGGAPPVGDGENSADENMNEKPILGCTSHVQVERAGVPLAVDSFTTSRSNRLLNEFCPFN